MTLARTPVLNVAMSLDPSGPDAERVRFYGASAFAKATQRAYAGDWRAFEAWCAHSGCRSMPAGCDAVAAYLTHLADAGKKWSTIGRARVSIGKMHGISGHPNPTADPRVKQVLAGIRRTIGTAKAKKTPIGPTALRAAFEGFSTTLPGIRNRALLMLGFAGGFRRSELVALEVRDLRFVSEGLEVTIRESKTDQEKQGRVIGIRRGKKADVCPVRLVRRWLELSHVSEGALFRSISKHGRMGTEALNAKTVERLVKAAARSAGFDPKDFGGHSLRSGLVTEAIHAGKAPHSIMAQTGHENIQVMHGYYRRANVFRDNVTEGLY